MTCTVSAISFVPKTSLLSPIYTPRFTRPSLEVFSFNVRSLFPKLDDLSLFCSTYHPDAICINETWLSSDIQNSEIALQNFHPFLSDRSRHGGGVTIYAHSSLHAIPLHLNNSQELLLLPVKLHECIFIFGAFYRPPTSLSDVVLLTGSLSTHSPNAFSGQVLTGDFNINLDASCSSLPLFRQFTVLSDLFSLKQLMSAPTHTSHTGSTSITDLVFVPSHVHASSLVLPPVSSSHHNSILTEISLPSPLLSRKCTKHRIWLYHLTDFDKAVLLLSSIQRDQLLSSNRDFSWMVFKDRFSAVIHLCVPSNFLVSSTCHPWIDNNLES